MGRMDEVVVGGVRLAFEVHGRPDSPKMVLLHALGDGRASWAAVAGRFSESFEVYALDLRGHGDSDWPGHYSFQAMFDDVTGLLDQLDLRSVVLVGHSMGGVVAYLIAQQRPDLVELLIIEDVAPPYPRDRAVPEPPTDTASLALDWDVVPAIVTEVNAGCPDMWARLSAIQLPTLLIGGGPDSSIPQDKLQDVANLVPTCELVTISVGHYVHKSKPDQFCDVIADWLERHHAGRQPE